MCQDSGEALGREEGEGAVGAKDPTAAGKGVLSKLPGQLVLP